MLLVAMTVSTHHKRMLYSECIAVSKAEVNDREDLINRSNTGRLDGPYQQEQHWTP